MIGICGYGFTGSGAVLDLLKEYEELFVIDEMEFSIPYSPDGLTALKANLVDYCSRSVSSVVAIRRFEKLVRSFNSPMSPWRKLTNNSFLPISKDYIDSLVQATWKGKLGFDITQYSWIQQRFRGSFLGRIQTLSDKTLKRYIPIVPIRTMKMSVNPEDFEIKTRRYVSNIISAINKGPKETVLNQPFPANRPETVFGFFDSPKAIIVDRDPRDVFVLAKNVVLSEARFMPCDDVYEYINYYRYIRKSINNNSDSEILRINFEDLVYEYDQTTQRIQDFLAIENHTSPKKYFDPYLSVVNTKLFNSIDDETTREEIRIIEKQLSDWIYDFDKHDTIKAYDGAKSF